MSDSIEFWILTGQPIDLNQQFPIANFTSKEKMEKYIKNSRLNKPIKDNEKVTRYFKKESLLYDYIDGSQGEYFAPYTKKKDEKDSKNDETIEVTCDFILQYHKSFTNGDLTTSPHPIDPEIK